MFAKRKQSLIKKAMELSVLCDCDVGLIIFSPESSGPGMGAQRLYQYSSISMDELLERYAAAVAEPHERRKNGEVGLAAHAICGVELSPKPSCINHIASCLLVWGLDGTVMRVLVGCSSALRSHAQSAHSVCKR